MDCGISVQVPGLVSACGEHLKIPSLDSSCDSQCRYAVHNGVPLRTSQRVAAIVAVLLTTAPLTSAAVVVTNGNAQTIALNDAVAGSGYGGDAQQLPKVVELCSSLLVHWNRPEGLVLQSPRRTVLEPEEWSMYE